MYFANIQLLQATLQAFKSNKITTFETSKHYIHHTDATLQQASQTLRLVTLHLLPLMYIYEMNDIMFFIKSYKQQSSHSKLLNMSSLVPLKHDLVHLKKMVHHRCSSNSAQNFYFYRLPRLWYSLPKIDLSLSTNIIKRKVYNYMWDHLMRQFNDTNVHTFHYLCPCCHCSTASPSPIYAVLL